tara:strand:+ start:1253 stop:1786 length:534 start_codon:yes stop_codon:yes gene_type:complete
MSLDSLPRKRSVDFCDRNSQGFTLVELMIVVVIVAILSAVAIPVFRGQVEKAKALEARTKMNVWLKELNQLYHEGADSTEMLLYLIHARTGVLRLENKNTESYFDYNYTYFPTRGTSSRFPSASIDASRVEGSTKKWIYSCIEFETGEIKMTKGIREQQSTNRFGTGIDPEINCGAL